PQAAHRRAAADLERPERRDELRRAASRAAAVRRRPGGAPPILCGTPYGEAGDHRLGADQLSLWRVDRGCPEEAGIRSLLRQELHALPRHTDPAPDTAGRALAGGRAMMQLLSLWGHTLAATLYAALTLSLLRDLRGSPDKRHLATAFAATAVWMSSVAVLGPQHLVSQLLSSG